MKHPALRVAAWEWIAPEYRARITDCILQRAVPTLPFRPVRVEVVGSLARGCGHAGSDLDLNLAARDWNEQVEWRRLWADAQHRARFREAVRPLEHDLGLCVDAAPDNPDQREYDITWDLLTGGRSDPAHAFPDRTSRWWSTESMRWRPRPLVRTCEPPGIDPWPLDQVAHWRRLHGRRYVPDVCTAKAWGRDPAHGVSEMLRSAPDRAERVTIEGRPR